MIPRIFRVLMTGRLRLARLGSPDATHSDQQELMLVHRQGASGEVLMISDTDAAPAGPRPDTRDLRPRISIVGLSTVAPRAAGSGFLLLDRLRAGLEPVGRFQPARGMASLHLRDGRLALRACGMFEPPQRVGASGWTPGADEALLSWSLELSAARWTGELLFCDGQFDP